MVYATIDDINLLHGPDLLRVIADRNNDGDVDIEIVTRALQDADAEIDGYVGSRYRLPIEVHSPVLRRIAVDIAVYRLALATDLRTDEMRVRYEDAIATLKDIVAGKMTLGIPDPVPDTENPRQSSPIMRSIRG